MTLYETYTVVPGDKEPPFESKAWWLWGRAHSTRELALVSVENAQALADSVGVLELPLVGAHQRPPIGFWLVRDKNRWGLVTDRIKQRHYRKEGDST